ncbi:hypothetical protein NPX13_g8841 [Xylaria arbuscula]|uniref:Amino acid permease/ SLC12A domain-containing protein n=1 Tax=Xylaria arbuscula TaxID=114810 RepID=A0A9W8TI13_9PEZI|nr:hypothetical protein NPX13_g8841 [Xylaria arbuscula]
MRLASKLVAVRIILLHLIPVFLLSLVLTSDTDSEGDSHNSGSTKELISPFVVAISQARIPVLPDFMNAVMVVSVFSMANAVVFAASRALQAVSAGGMGPRFCARLYRDKPLGALLVVFIFSLLSFVKGARNGDEVFVWLLSLNSCSNYLTWSSICIAQIRCRLALKRQGKSFHDPQAYRSPLGMAGSVFSIAVFAYGLAAQIVAAAKSPLSHPPPVAASFLGLAVVILLWVGYVVYKRDRTLLIPLNMIELGPKESMFMAEDHLDSNQTAL